MLRKYREKEKIDSFFKDSKPKCILNIEERDQGRWLSTTVTWTGWRCREGERVRECGEREGQRAGSVGVTRIEACYWLWKNTLGSGAEREGRRGGRHPLIFEPRFPAGVMATVHRAFSPSVIPPLVVFFARRNTAFPLLRLPPNHPLCRVLGIVWQYDVIITICPCRLLPSSGVSR